MQSPETHRSESLPVRAFKHLLPGRHYRVVHAFTDYDGTEHPEGEAWTFLTSSFLPYEDGLSLFVEMHDGSRRQIRLQWRPEAQMAVIDALELYLVEQPTEGKP